MDRKAGRLLAKETLEDLDLFGQIEQSEPDTLTAPLVAVVHSKGLGITQEARDVWSSQAELFVTIFVRRAPGASDAAEDLLDDLVRASMRALFEAFEPLVDKLQIVSVAGTPPTPKGIDGKNYRMERFSVRFSDDGE